MTALQLGPYSRHLSKAAMMRGQQAMLTQFFLHHHLLPWSSTIKLNAALGAYPTITIRGEPHVATDGTYTITTGTNRYSRPTLTPGGLVTQSFNWNAVLRPFEQFKGVAPDQFPKLSSLNVQLLNVQ